MVPGYCPFLCCLFRELSDRLRWRNACCRLQQWSLFTDVARHSKEVWWGHWGLWDQHTYFNTRLLIAKLPARPENKPVCTLVTHGQGTISIDHLVCSSTSLSPSGSTVPSWAAIPNFRAPESHTGFAHRNKTDPDIVKALVLGWDFFLWLPAVCIQSFCQSKKTYILCAPVTWPQHLSIPSIDREHDEDTFLPACSCARHVRSHTLTCKISISGLNPGIYNSSRAPCAFFLKKANKSVNNQFPNWN